MKEGRKDARLKGRKRRTDGSKEGRKGAQTDKEGARDGRNLCLPSA
jgi:hypothetical protein